MPMIHYMSINLGKGNAMDNATINIPTGAAAAIFWKDELEKSEIWMKFVHKMPTGTDVDYLDAAGEALANLPDDEYCIWVCVKCYQGFVHNFQIASDDFVAAALLDPPCFICEKTIEGPAENRLELQSVFDCAETIIHNIELIRQDAFSDDVDFEQIRYDLTNLAARVMETVQELY